VKFIREPENILKEIGIYEPEDIELPLVAFHLGAHVKTIAMSDCEGYIIGTHEQAIISINSGVPEQRQRFSLGHELGHWVNDRGKNLTYRCDSADMNQRNSKLSNFRQQKEVRANQFSARLLMPNHILPNYIDPLAVTWEQISHIANTFSVSRTTAAIRFVELTDLPCMLVAWSTSGVRKWFLRGSAIPDSIWPLKRIMRPLQHFSHDRFSVPKEVDADTWVDEVGAERYELVESQFFNGYEILTLLWWKDESQLLEKL
jgi:hypothetical protein